jgi:hypothetical protein
MIGKHEEDKWWREREREGRGRVEEGWVKAGTKAADLEGKNDR